jgi:hypothetical protein
MLQEFVDAEGVGPKGGHLPVKLEVSSFLNPESIWELVMTLLLLKDEVSLEHHRMDKAECRK